MKNSAYRNRVIDLHGYFAAQQAQNIVRPQRAVRLWNVAERVVTSVAAL